MDREWVEKQWQRAELGDKRLTRRAIKVGKACLDTPDGSLPEKFGAWGNTKGAQLKTGKRLLALLGILGIVATQLLKLRDLSRQQPDRLAEELVAKEVVNIVKSKYKLVGEINLKELWRRIAMMGGFLGRKSDGKPGWQTIWKGWLRIQDMLEGMAMVKNCG
jgi:hypothetical protein